MTIFYKRLCKVISIVVCFCVLSFSIYIPSYADDGLPPPGECPQPRFTDKAPDKFLRLVNPLPADKKNLKFAKKLYQSAARPLPCSQCHGKKGDGKGNLAAQFNPPPRNFGCAETVNGIPDGQLFWIIKNGSPGTSMPGFKNLSDEQIWQLVQYLRFLANNK
jgi:hypothetical protein